MIFPPVPQLFSVVDVIFHEGLLRGYLCIVDGVVVDYMCRGFNEIGVMMIRIRFESILIYQPL